MKVLIAYNNGRFYREDRMHMRYFPVKRAEAELMLATGKAVEVPYLPLSRPDLLEAYEAAQEALAAIRLAAA